MATGNRLTHIPELAVGLVNPADKKPVSLGKVYVKDVDTDTEVDVYDNRQGVGSPITQPIQLDEIGRATSGGSFTLCYVEGVVKLEVLDANDTALFQINDGMKLRYYNTSVAEFNGTSYTAAAADDWVIYNATPGSSFTLPPHADAEVPLFLVNVGASDITVQGDATIGGSATYTVKPNQSTVFIPGSTEWKVGLVDSSTLGGYSAALVPGVNEIPVTDSLKRIVLHRQDGVGVGGYAQQDSSNTTRTLLRLNDSDEVEIYNESGSVALKVVGNQVIVQPSMQIVLPNNLPLQAKDSGGTVRDIIGVDGSDRTIVKDPANNTLLALDASNTSNPLGIPDDSIFTNAIQDGAVHNSKLADNTLKKGKIAQLNSGTSYTYFSHSDSINPTNDQEWVLFCVIYILNTGTVRIEGTAHGDDSTPNDISSRRIGMFKNLRLPYEEVKPKSDADLQVTSITTSSSGATYTLDSSYSVTRGDVLSFYVMRDFRVLYLTNISLKVNDSEYL